jgi:hypothetical protein
VWFEQLQRLIDRVGAAQVAELVTKWIRAATASSVYHLNRPGGNRTILHAMLWTVTRTPTTAAIDAVRQLGVFAMNNNAAQGSTIAIVLSQIATEDALAALQLLAQSAKRPSPRTRFRRGAAHVERSLGITADDAAEQFVPTYELSPQGTKRFDLGDASAEIRICGSRVEIEWRDAHGKTITSPPAKIKKAHAVAIKDIKAAAKTIGSMLLVQRDRIDQMMRFHREWELGVFEKRYLDHPLIGQLSRGLIWMINAKPVLFADGQPRDAEGKIVRASGSAKVELWHPIGRKPAEILAWRRRLESLEITQPFKQAHREIYLLTDAERRTATYSNRFAAHILRQHQFNQLARTRGWTYQLQGNWDGGSDRGQARRDVPGTDLRAEFWVSAEALEQTTGAGIVLYISTDQLRFYRLGEDQPMRLADVPPLAFSETMRDVDLFVGVASVGNDPNWNDGGPRGRYRAYWREFSFGDLSETARTRRAVLEALLPRLSKIRQRCILSERFLVVRGDVRTYKIHLGSGNILMEPNDQYLCIVADRARTADRATENLFLPFEGDSTLSVILSKAFMLADDAKIDDPTIVRQIRQG